jgi:hypothetical protein
MYWFVFSRDVRQAAHYNITSVFITSVFIIPSNTSTPGGAPQLFLKYIQTHSSFQKRIQKTLHAENVSFNMVLLSSRINLL